MKLMLLEKIIGSEAYNSLSEEIKNKHGKANFEDVSGGKYVPKSRLDTEIEKTNQYESSIQEMIKLKEDINSAKDILQNENFVKNLK